VKSTDVCFQIINEILFPVLRDRAGFRSVVVQKGLVVAYASFNVLLVWEPPVAKVIERVMHAVEYFLVLGVIVVCEREHLFHAILLV
jgi:hypothetical protein